MQRDDGIDATMLRKVPVAVGKDVWSDTNTIVDNGDVVTMIADTRTTDDFCRISTKGGNEGYIRRAYLEVAGTKTDRSSSAGGKAMYGGRNGGCRSNRTEEEVSNTAKSLGQISYRMAFNQRK